MERKLKTASGLRIQGVIALLALLFAAPIAFANTSNATLPPSPTVTSPSPNSRLPDPGKITITGTAPSLTKVSVRVKATHVRNGKRVDGQSAGPRGATISSNGQWKVDLDLPRMERGWEDVRYTITAVLYWDKRPEQVHVSDKPSAATTVEVFPQAQPEPLPVAPPPPVILMPTSGTTLKWAENFRVTGTGTPGNQVKVSTQLFYALENNPGREQKNNGLSAQTTVDKNGKWQTLIGYGGYTSSNYVNPRVQIVAKEIHREKSSLVSHETIREVGVEVPAKREPTPAETREAMIRLPAGTIPRDIAIKPGVREALLRPMAKITSPAGNSRVSGALDVSGTAAPGSNLQVSVKRTLKAPGRAGGKPMPARGGSAEDLGTFTAKADSKGVWKIRPVTLPSVRDRESGPTVEVEITVVELLADGKKSTPHTVTVKQDR